MSPSIRLRLLLWLSPILLLTGIAFAVLTYFNVQEEIDELFDKVLRENAYSLLNIAAEYDPASPQRTLSPAADIDLVSQIWDAAGRLVYRSHPFSPLPDVADRDWAVVDWRGEPWRVFTLRTNDRVIQVAQLQSERRQTADEIALHLLMPLLVLLPGLALLVWFGLGRGLRPLQDIVEAVKKRTPESLQPIIPGQNLPHEVGTLVTALNGLLHRLDEALAAQRQFIADAAHELRTPLTALSLQAQVAERTVDPDKKAASLRTLRQGIARATHLVEQLLTLARLDPDAAWQPFAPLRLDELAQSAAGDFVPLAAEKGIDLGVTMAEPVVVSGEADALRILLGNLLDNAIRYTPAGGRVDVSVLAEGDAVRLEVGDTGPGIPPEERGRVFDRFYRGVGNPEPGSGLGLAIVKRIADRHGAVVRVEEGEAGRGVKVSVHFPAYRPGAILSEHEEYRH